MRRTLKKQEPTERVPLDVRHADPQVGLTGEEVALRVSSGYANTAIKPPTKTVGQIISSNLLTYFNFVFFFLAACIIAVNAWNNLVFMPVVICNIAIGIIQEIRSKRTLDNLSILTAPKAKAIREGQEVILGVEEMVRDDIAVFSAGNQVYADAVLVTGECMVNEALITGEADEIRKRPGDQLLSGSFLVNGSCRARLTSVGADSFVSRLTIEAKKTAGRAKSEMMDSLSRLVKWIGITIFPLGAILIVKEIFWLDRGVQEGVVSTVAALVGMIPEGLYLLTSLALMAGILRLAQRKTLVHELNCIETLARVDTLCVDKTGTVTENKMTVEDVSLLCEDRFSLEDIRMIMADYVYAMQDDNDTMIALKRYFTGSVTQSAMETLPFSSSRKYGGVSFHPEETYLLGAPDIMLGKDFDRYAEKIDYYSEKGCRVLLLALYDGRLDDETLDAPLMPLALVLLTNKIRKEAPATFAFFAKQGVSIKVISGDNAMAVSEVARRAGISGAERFVDARMLDTDEKITIAAENYTVFGRVTPEQKRKLILAMKAAGKTVAMTGDGVNDVLALKAADVGIAMASGSEVACQVSDIVLLNSNFSSMPSVVMEGRRVINNIERAAALFLVKNIFSFSLALITLFFTLPYPITSAQLSLVSTLTIGIPAFVLALEPNRSLVKGRFITNILYRALPGGLTDLLLVIGIIILNSVLHTDLDQTSTVCAMTLGVVGLVMLYRTCKPFTALRRVLMGMVLTAFIFATIFLKDLFDLAKLSLTSALIFVIFALLAWPVMEALSQAVDIVNAFCKKKIRALRARSPRRAR